MGLYEYCYDTGFNSFVYGNNLFGQSFTVGTVGTNENNYLTFIKLRASRYGSPGDVVINVYAVDAFGHPTGAVLSTGSLDGNGFGTSTSTQTFEMTRTLLTAGIQYVFTVAAASGNGTNYVAIDGSGDDPCFLKHTTITMNDGTQKPIEDVHIGDFILSYDVNSKQVVTSNVLETVHHRHTEGYHILYFEDGTKLSVTGNHPLYTLKEYTPVEQLHVGDTVAKLHTDTLSDCTITKIELVNTIVDTYNLTVAKTNNYFAGGILAHNK